MLQDTNRLAEAEPLMRRALAIDEQSYGTDHPDVARDLNNLAQLLQATNRLAEAEPLMRRAVKIIQNFGEEIGYEHPHAAGLHQELSRPAPGHEQQAAWAHGEAPRGAGARRSAGLAPVPSN